MFASWESFEMVFSLLFFTFDEKSGNHGGLAQRMSIQMKRCTPFCQNVLSFWSCPDGSCPKGSKNCYIERWESYGYSVAKWKGMRKKGKQKERRKIKKDGEKDEKWGGKGRGQTQLDATSARESKLCVSGKHNDRESSNNAQRLSYNTPEATCGL